MTTSAIRNKLTNYLQVADAKKVKAIYTMLEDEINTTANDWTEEFEAEMESRRNSFINASAKTYSWNETKEAAVKRLKSKK